MVVGAGIQENFRFMVIEVTKQVEDTLKAIKDPTPAIMEKIEIRDDHIDNQKSIIENACFSRIHGPGAVDKRTIDSMRAVNIITGNLERIADFCVNIISQLQHMTDRHFMERYDYEAFFREIFLALDLVVDALFSQDIPRAFKICRSEFNLDVLYKEVFDRILRELRTGVGVENLITSHLIFRYLERMGDSLLNIGEAVIFAAVGEKFKIHQYEALKGTLEAMGSEIPISDVEFQSIWGTRSGCRVGRIQAGSKGKKARGVIFKEGNRKKILQEKENIERWERIMPGLPPKIHACMVEEAEPHATLLVEYLSDFTYQDIILTADRDSLEDAVALLTRTMGTIWERTMRPVPASAGFMPQLASRMEDVYRLHPRFRMPRRRVDGLDIPPAEELVAGAGELEKALPAPFSVFIHGDFNINNIVYVQDERRVHYIDLHRSKDTDYLQDVSVFLVSNFRLPMLEAEPRRRLNLVMDRMLAFSRDFAARHDDATFEMRLALGLARSFITSTRFELDRKFAKTMYLRGIYLLEKLLAHGQDRPEAFALPDSVLVY